MSLVNSKEHLHTKIPHWEKAIVSWENDHEPWENGLAYLEIWGNLAFNYYCTTVVGSMRACRRTARQSRLDRVRH